MPLKLEKTIQHSSITEHKQPKGVKTKLVKHQNQGLTWFLKQEKTKGSGLLLDPTGLGKSLICIAAITESPVKGGTLVLCPSHLIKNWEYEIKIHTKKNILDVHIHSGPKRDTIFGGLKIRKNTVIISSYDNVYRDIKGKKNGVPNHKFGRIILDEAHIIRNRGSKKSKAVLELHCRQYRWVVTGTPIFNFIDDMYILFKFLEIGGIDDFKDWKKKFNPKDSSSFKELHDYMAKYTLRRSKDILGLPPKKVILKKIRLSESEREFYDALHTYSITRLKSLIEKYKRSHENKSKIQSLLFNNILVFILRLRQASTNPFLVIKHMKRIKSKEVGKATEELKFFITQKQAGVTDECPVCMDAYADTITKPCGHKLCERCWNKIYEMNKTTDDPACPVCRTPISDTENLLNPKEKKKEDIAIGNVSSKMDFLHKKILKNPKKGFIIVSQWRLMLEYTRDHLKKKWKKEHGKKLKYIELDGDTSPEKRFELVRNFQTDKNINVCFLSLGASAEGITLTKATRMFLIDKWWNSSKELQVMDRIHRLGQTHSVKIYRLHSPETIEDAIQQLIDRKEKMANIALGAQKIPKNNKWLSNVIKLIDKPPEVTPLGK